MKPSELAGNFFRLAVDHNRLPDKDMPTSLQNTLHATIQGLEAMSTGLRATYIKLEEIEKLIRARH